MDVNLLGENMYDPHVRPFSKSLFEDRCKELVLKPKNHYNIPLPVTDVVIFYSNGNEECRAVEKLLRDHSITCDDGGPLDEGSYYPLVQFHAWDYEGLE